MTGRIVVGDCRETLKSLPDESVNCVVTSPPYFGLRDYGTARWEGGDPECTHQLARAWVSDSGGLLTDRKEHAGILAANAAKPSRRQGSVCPCGATKFDRQIGLEPTPAEFVAAMVEVFAEIWRVLRSDGVVWLNLGDSYANDGKWGGHTGGKHAKALHCSPIGRNKKYTGCKPKDLIGIPWRVAFALQDAGWYLRQDIIWNKPNPMPESVRDRCTKAHEYLFMFSKSPRYYFDSEAIKEPAVSDHPSGNGFKRSARRSDKNADGTARGNDEQWSEVGGLRNKRSVWTVTTRPFKEAHFATFPPALIEPCILAGCPKGGTVLDPFLGAGTTGLVAQQHGRKWIGCELNPEYVKIARNRIWPPVPLTPFTIATIAV